MDIMVAVCWDSHGTISKRFVTIQGHDGRAYWLILLGYWFSCGPKFAFVL